MAPESCGFCCVPIDPGDEYYTLQATDDPTVTLAVCAFCHDRWQQSGTLQGEEELSSWLNAPVESESISMDEARAILEDLVRDHVREHGRDWPSASRGQPT